MSLNFPNFVTVSVVVALLVAGCSSPQDSSVGQTVPTLSTDQVAIEKVDIPLTKDIKIDGEFKDWRKVRPVYVGTKDHLYIGPEHWVDPDDLCYTARLATDGELLYVLVNVQDDQTKIDADEPWRNDAVEFFWDFRPDAERDGKHGEATGQVILVVPETDKPAEVSFYNVRQEFPDRLKSAFRRHEKGYLCEFSLPLADMGMKGKAQAGTSFHFDLQVDDRDVVEGIECLSMMSLVGKPESFKSTEYYIRGTVK